MLCCYYSEFDNKVGPKIVYQYPLNYISMEDYDFLSDYSITVSSLSKQLIMMNYQNKIYMAYPVRISNKKYERHALFFSVGFVLEENISNIQNYKLLLSKLGQFLYQLELECEYLFLEKSKIKYLINSVYMQLKSSNQCVIYINSSNILNLQLFSGGDITKKKSAESSTFNNNKKNKKKQLLQISDVPYPLINSFEPLKNNSWDLTFIKILDYINGYYNMKDISQCSHVDLNICMKIIQQFIDYNLIQIIDIFQLENEYVIIDLLSHLDEEFLELYHFSLSNEEEEEGTEDDDDTHDDDDDDAVSTSTSISPLITTSIQTTTEGGKSKQKEEITSITTEEIITEEEKKKIEINSILIQAYLALKRNITVYEIYKSYKFDQYNIDIRKFIVFLLLKKKIRRIHYYPFLVDDTVHPESYDNDNDTARNVQEEQEQEHEQSQQQPKEKYEEDDEEEDESSFYLNHQLLQDKTNIQLLNILKKNEKLNGTYSYDNLCCYLQIPLKRLKSILKLDSNIKIFSD